MRRAQAVWGADPEQISLLYVLIYTAAAGNEKTPGSFLKLLTTKDGAQERRFTGGSQVISQRVADRLGSRVILKAPVRRIAQDAHGVRVLADGVTVEAARVVVAVPPALARDIRYAPSLPADKLGILRAFVPGNLAKCEAVYETPFWRQAGLSGQGVSDGGATNTIFDNSPPDGSPGILFGFVGGRNKAPWAKLPARRAPGTGPRHLRGVRRRRARGPRSTTSSRTGPRRSGTRAARSGTPPPER